MDKPFELRDFRLFLAVAEELHFRRAAERLGMQQPHLSQHIRSFEDRVGVQLLERTTRSVRLTPAGERFVERARYALSQADYAVDQARKFAGGSVGQLDICFTSSAIFNVLPWILMNFRARHPNVGLSLHRAGSAAQVPDLIAGRRQFGFLRLPVHSRELSTLTLAREGVVVALPRAHHLADRTQLSLEDLADEDFIRVSPTLGVDFQEHVESYCRRAGFHPRIAIDATDTNAVIGFVAAGFGVAVVPEYTGRMGHSHVVFKRLRRLSVQVDLAVAWVTSEQTSVQTSFLDVVNEYLAQNPLD
jgi:DNA-binding transcriptional LysR family regulator